MLSNIDLGYLGAIVATLFFGSNYVPIKKHNTGDGVLHALLMAIGIFIVGLATIFFMPSHTLTLYPGGFVGGGLWALGNLMVVPIIEYIGLGPGFLLWSFGNLCFGWLLGYFGLFGVRKETITHPWANFAGFGAGVFCLLLFLGIAPEEAAISDSSIPLMRPHSPRRNASRRVLGIFMGLLAGGLYSVNLVPFMLWRQVQPTTPGPLDFAFSQFCGILFTTLVVFFLYCLVSNPPATYPKTLHLSIISGVMWGIACCGWMVSTEFLGFTEGYPIVAVGPILVTLLWSVLYFREITRPRNLFFLILTVICCIASCGLLVYSKL